MPEQLPVWLSPGVEPPESLKTNGWQPGMKPSAQHMNWLFNCIYIALKELQDGGNLAEIEKILTQLEKNFATHKAEKASLTTSGHTQLSNATDSTSDTLSATPAAVKQAYDRGNVAFNNEAELRVEFNAFKAALTEGFTANQFSDGLTTLDAFTVVTGYYNLPLTRLEV